MFEQLLIHKTAKDTLTALAPQPPQGILLVGPSGIGKLTIATAWAQTITNHATNIHIITPDEKGTLTIETIRDLYKTTRSRQEGRQVMIIDQADRMSLEAENAFLKLLEEPRDGLTFILTSTQLETLLPTVLSRVQRVQLQPVTDEAIRRLIVSKKPGIAAGDLSQLLFLAQGRPGRALALLAEDGLPAQREQMQLAKQLVTAKPYDRLIHINKLAGDRDTCLASLEAMARIVEIQLKTTTLPAQLTHWLKLSQALESALQAISHNGNVRAQLLQLFSSY